MDEAYGRRFAVDMVAEIFRRHKLYAPPSSGEHRVRISGLTDRRELNGLHGMAQNGRSGKQRVVIEGYGGAAFNLNPENLALAPPAPADVDYNNGTGAFQLRQNAAAPRRLQKGSGRPSYSKCIAHQEAIPPPIAGSLLPRNDPPTEFQEAWKDGSLPVRISGDAGGQKLRWIDPLTGGDVPRDQVDARRWLPVLIAGVRDAPSAGGCYVALRGAIELATSAAKAGTLPALMPAAAPAIKAALDLRERSVVCAGLRLLLLLLHADARVGLALRPHYKVLLPAMSAFKLHGQPSLSDEIERSQHRRINVCGLIDEALQALEKFGGPGAGELIRSYVPTFMPASEVLHRGFR